MEAIVNYEQGWKFSVQCGRHTVHVDLPQESGGNDEAPNPPQYFLASLSSCVGVYVLSFCKNSGLNADGMQIKISAKKAQHPSRLENINIEIALPNAQVGKRKVRGEKLPCAQYDRTASAD